MASKVTANGAIAARINKVQGLKRLILTSMLDDDLNVDGVGVKQAIEDLATSIIKTRPDGAQIVSELAVSARTDYKLRTTPLVLINALIRSNNKKARELVASTIEQVIQRPDELGKLIEVYRAGDRTVPLSNQMKVGLSQAFKKFNRFQLGKYKSIGTYTLRDVMFLVHPKPVDGGVGFTKEERKRVKTENSPVKLTGQAKDWYDLAEDKIEVVDTWETELSAGKDKKATFTRLLEENKLGAMALLRNLRNMIQAGVDNSLIKKALGEMKTERVLPFRFITAAKYAPKLEEELQTAMFKCLDGQEKLPGKTVLLVDNSGSMSSPVSSKSELSCYDAAGALAMLLREVCESVEIIVFGSTAGVIPATRGFKLRNDILISSHNGGTETDKALRLARERGYDRCIVITDEQSSTKIPNPIEGSLGYFINVGNHKNGIGYRQWVHLDGWSEAIVDFIIEYEKFLKEEVIEEGSEKVMEAGAET